VLIVKTKGCPVPKTFQATQARRRHYDQAIRSAATFIKQARLELFTKAEDLAWFLDLENVPSPTGKPWTAHAVHRMLRALRRRGLDIGSYAPSEARGAGYYDGSLELRAAALSRRRLYKKDAASPSKSNASGCTHAPTNLNDAITGMNEPPIASALAARQNVDPR